MKNFTICLSVMIAFMLSIPAMAQNNAKTISAGSEADYVSDGENYRLKLEQTDNTIHLKVLDLTGKELQDTKNVTGFMGLMYSDGTSEEFDLTANGKNKSFVNIPAGKTVSFVRMIVEVDGDRNITGFNMETGRTPSGNQTHSNQ